MFAYLICAVTVAFAAAAHRHTYYLPGVAPQTYNKAESVSKSFVTVALSQLELI